MSYFAAVISCLPRQRNGVLEETLEQLHGGGIPQPRIFIYPEAGRDCSATHRRNTGKNQRQALQYFLTDTNEDYLLLLEDDLIVSENFSIIVEGACLEERHIFTFFAAGKKFYKGLPLEAVIRGGCVEPGFYELRYSKWFTSSLALLMSRRTVSEMMRYEWRTKSKKDLPLDHWIGNHFMLPNKYEFWTYLPNPIINRIDVRSETYHENWLAWHTFFPFDNVTEDGEAKALTDKEAMKRYRALVHPNDLKKWKHLWTGIENGESTKIHRR